jgi:hypothetical protein
VENSGPRKALNRQVLSRQPYLIWNAFVDIVALTPYEELHPRQRPAHLVFWYDAEVHNGGHYQYFENPAGRRARETVQALGELGFSCQKTVLTKATEAWESRDRRPPQNVEEFAENALDGEFDKFDEEYHACKPSTDQLLERYVAENRDLFVVLVDAAQPPSR